MPQHPSPRLKVPPPVRHLPPAPHPFRHTDPPQPPTAATVADPRQPSELTFSKIVAGAGAAATTAVTGSFLGPAETVMGAAVGSVVSAIATTWYERPLDRTRDTVKARIRPPGGRSVDGADTVEDTVEIPALGVAAGGRPGRAGVSVAQQRPTTVLPSAPPPARIRRRWVVLTALTAGVFLIGLLAVTGLELLKGSTLRGETGTSVGRVVDPRPASSDTADSPETTEPAEPPGTSGMSGLTGDEPTDEASESEWESESESEPAAEESDRDAEHGAGAEDDPDEESATEEADLDADSTVVPLPAQVPGGG